MEKELPPEIGILYHILINDGGNVSRFELKIPAVELMPPFPPGVDWVSTDGKHSIKTWISGYLKQK